MPEEEIKKQIKMKVESLVNEANFSIESDIVKQKVYEKIWCLLNNHQITIDEIKTEITSERMISLIVENERVVIYPFKVNNTVEYFTIDSELKKTNGEYETRQVVHDRQGNDISSLAVITTEKLENYPNPLDTLNGRMLKIKKKSLINSQIRSERIETIPGIYYNFGIERNSGKYPEFTTEFIGTEVICGKKPGIEYTALEINKEIVPISAGVDECAYNTSNNPCLGNVLNSELKKSQDEILVSLAKLMGNCNASDLLEYIRHIDDFEQRRHQL